MPASKKISEEQQMELLETLKSRFEENRNRHEKHEWSAVEKRLKVNPNALWSLYNMEVTGGEPDVVDLGEGSDEICFVDCSEESPDGRRSVCYDREGLESRKAHKPDHTADEMAKAMGINLLTEDQYRKLQEFGPFDSKTSSWLKTPDEMRKLGGALFGDYRFGRVFIYHNGAQSYYAARGFRGLLKA